MGNKTFLLRTVSLLLTLVLGVCQSAQAGGELKTVQASGVGSGVERAAKAGLVQAVQTATGQLPSGGKFQLLLTETVAASADDFVAGYEIINKRHEEDEYAARHPELNLDRPGEWQVQLSVKVDFPALRKRWQELSGLLEKKTPVVLILGEDKVNGQSTGESVSADQIANTLGKFLIQTVSIDDLSEDQKAVIESAGQVAVKQALSIASELKADMVIVSHADAGIDKSVDNGLSASWAKTKVQLFQVDKITPLGSYTIIRKPALYSETADPARRILMTQARILMPQVLDGFLWIWPEVMAISVEQEASPKQNEVE